MLNHEFPPVGGGAAPVTLELCKHLVFLGHHVDVVTMHYGDLPSFEVIDGVNVYRTPAIRKRPNICYTHEMATYLPGAFFKTLKLCRKEKYDIIHCHFIVPGAPLAWLMSKLTGIPFIVTCHGSDVPGYNTDRFKLTHKFLAPAWSFLAKRAHILVSPSRSLKKIILAQNQKLHVDIIPNGIYADRFTPGQKQKSILMCSRLLPRKGFQYVIKALQPLDFDWQINIIGQGPYLEELKKLADDCIMPVEFWGWLDQNDPKFKELYETSSIFVFPSEAENFPSVLLEAMSSGMAVITSTAGGCPEVVGDAGILVRPGNVEEIRAAIVKLIESEDLRNELATAALERVKIFSWQNITKQYIDCYETVIRKANRR